jgi:ATP synthase protein I
LIFVSLARDIRKLAVLQLALVAATSVVFLLIEGGHPAGSAWFGGGIAAANIGLLLWRRQGAAAGPALSAAQSMQLLYRTALERFVIVVTLFAVGMGLLQLDPLALLAGFIAGQVALFFIGNERKSERHGV